MPLKLFWHLYLPEQGFIVWAISIWYNMKLAQLSHTPRYFLLRLLACQTPRVLYCTAHVIRIQTLLNIPIPI